MDTTVRTEELSSEEETFICSNCHEEQPLIDCSYIGEEAICIACYDEHTITCSNCDERIWLEDNAGNDSTPLCQHCYDNHYTRCERCECLIDNDDAYYDDEGGYPYCECCYQHCNHGAIHDYSYKPEPIFHGKGSRYFGVELEIDVGGRDSNYARKIAEAANSKVEHIYIKADSSLDDGLEIVTHPCTLAYHMNCLPWPAVLSRARGLGYLSHKADTCGLHIHVNRDSFTDNYERHEACIGRVLFFVEKHWEELLKFSRRNEEQLNRWAARYGFKNKPKDILDHAKKGYLGRYTCLNLHNNPTIEFRIFRGTLKYNTLIAALQLVDAICEAAFSMSDEEVAALSWTSFVESVTALELITYLKERRLYINEPVETSEEEE